MKPTFLNQQKPLLTVMLQCETPELIIGRTRNALCDGAEAFGLQAEWLKPEYQKLFSAEERRMCKERLESYGYKINL